MKSLISFVICAMLAACASAQTSPATSTPGQVPTVQSKVERAGCAVLYDPAMQTFAPKCLTLDEVQAFREGKLRGAFVTNPILDRDGNLIRVEMITPPKRP